MKKLWLAVGGAVIIVAIALVLFFTLFYRGDNATNSIELNGSWLVYQYGENKIDDEFLVFEGNTVKDYRNSEVFATSTFTYSNDKLDMPDISKEFAVSVKSDNFIVLIQPDTVEWKLARVSNEASSIAGLTAEELVGEYDVVMVAGEKRTGETMTFTPDSFSDVRDGNAYLSCKYYLDNNGHLLHASEIQKDFFVYVNGKNLILIDCTDRYVWELIKQ